MGYNCGPKEKPPDIPEMFSLLDKNIRFNFRVSTQGTNFYFHILFRKISKYKDKQSLMNIYMVLAYLIFVTDGICVKIFRCKTNKIERKQVHTF